MSDTYLHQQRNVRALASAEAAWLREPEPVQPCECRQCHAPFCTRKPCPDPDRKADELWERRRDD